MPGKLSTKSAIIAGGACTIAIGALSLAMVMGPASADDLTASPSASASTGAPSVDGFQGGHGGPGRMGMEPGVSAIGTVLIKTETFKAADGTVTIVRHQQGEITAVSASSITIKSSSVERTYVINADTVALGNTVDALAVGDSVGIEATVDGDTATATEIHSRPADGQPGDQPAGQPGDMGRHGGPEGMGGPAARDALGVETAEELIVEKADGSIVTLNETEGTVVSVSGTTLTITNAAGETVTFEVPSSVTPERNRADAALSDFVAGDDVHVLVDASSGAVVAVHGHDASAMSDGPMGGRRGHGGHGHGGPQGDDVAALPSADSNNA